MVVLLMGAAVAMTVAAGAGYGQSGDASGQVYPEGHRFKAQAFVEGLKRRGLTDLLALHLEEHPPDDPVRAKLLARDIKLSEHADASRNGAERRVALVEANRLLRALIDEHGDHDDARQWRIELAESLLYEEADPYTANILFRGGTKRDRSALRPLAKRALSGLVALQVKLQREYDALDHMAARQYDRLEASGAVDRLERDIGLVDYLSAWARFYRALALDADDPQAMNELRLVIEYLEDRSHLLHTPHATTHYQAQALLLAGMANRRLGEFRRSRAQLGQAIDVAENVPRGEERQGLAWVVTLGRVELIRSLMDIGDFAGAREAARLFRNEAMQGGGDFAALLTAGLAERALYRAEAERADRRGDAAEARRLRQRSVGFLGELAGRDIAYRDQVYAALFELLFFDADPSRLQPFERSALLAGALGESEALARRIEGALRRGEAPEELERRRATVLDRAIHIAEPIVSDDDMPAGVDAAEVTFNVAVALHKRGRRLEAATRFLQVADHFPRFFRAADAATFAVQLAWEMSRDAGLASRGEIQQLYLDALTTLTERYPDSEGGRYWLFFLGQHLSGLQRFDEAADAFGRVHPEHPNYASAVFLEAESLVSQLKRMASDEPERIEAVNRRATHAIQTAKDAQSRLESLAMEAADAERRAELSGLAARAAVLAAEGCAVDGVERWRNVLEALADFEQKFPGHDALMGQVLRLRMIAFEALGRHEEAAGLIPRYVETDPESAPATLQGLYRMLQEEIERDRMLGRDEQASERAASAVVIAEGIYALAEQSPQAFGEAGVYGLRLQLAEALLETDQHARAKALFERCRAEDASRYEDGEARDSRVIMGLAQAHFALSKYEEALPLFHRAFRGFDRGSQMWWLALLRDLQCRTELGYDAGRIIKTIHQHRALDREMGGIELRRGFDAVLTANEKREQRS